MKAEHFLMGFKKHVITTIAYICFVCTAVPTAAFSSTLIEACTDVRAKNDTQKKRADQVLNCLEKLAIELEGEKARAGILPDGSVVAMLGPCPRPYWVPFNAGIGRFLIGAGDNHNNGSSYAAFDPENPTAAPPQGKRPASGGEESITLGISNIPAHNHIVAEVVGGAHDMRLGLGPHTYIFPPGSINPEHVNSKPQPFKSADNAALQGSAYNYLPPYLALHFCKKVTPKDQ